MGNKIRVYTSDLQLGMYIAELDRPWTDTPFMFQGFILRKESEIETLRGYCDYVYVDEEQSQADVAAKLTLLRPVTGEEERADAARASGKSDFSEAVFRSSLTRSHAVYRDARCWIDQMLEDSRLGTSIDTDQARALVTQLADEVIRNPDALIWLTYLKSRDEYTATHCMNVCILALTFGRCLGLDETALHQLGLGALLHDLGKMQIPGEVLNKPGRLTEEEFAIIKKHPGLGFAMLRDDKNLDKASLHIVLHHHERLDGRGYPRGLGEKKIPLLTRISSIVDVYDAITSDRCYHDGIAPAQALENLFKWASGNFDVALLERFIKCIGIYPIGSVVRLSSGEVGIIVASDECNRLKPILLIVQNAEGKPVAPRRLINMASASWEKGGGGPSIEQVLEPKDVGVDIKAVLQQELDLSSLDGASG